MLVNALLRIAVGVHWPEVLMCGGQRSWAWPLPHGECGTDFVRVASGSPAAVSGAGRSLWSIAGIRVDSSHKRCRGLLYRVTSQVRSGPSRIVGRVQRTRLTLWSAACWSGWVRVWWRAQQRGCSARTSLSVVVTRMRSASQDSAAGDARVHGVEARCGCCDPGRFVPVPSKWSSAPVFA